MDFGSSTAINQNIIPMEEANGQKEAKERQEHERQNGPTTASRRTIRGLRWICIVLAILSSTFFFGLDNTVVADVQAVIVDQFGSVDRLPWISVSFLIGAASTNFF